MIKLRGTAVYDGKGMLFIPDSLVASAAQDGDRDGFIDRVVEEMSRPLPRAPKR